MKHFLIASVCLFFISGHAQRRPDVQISDTLLQQIEKDIWIPFMEAYKFSDSKKLKSIHTKDIIRVTLDENRIQNGEAYLERFGNFVESVKQQGNKIEIAFAILSTALDDSGQLAYQRGYYRFSSQRADEKEPTIRGYGEFNVGLKKENGAWKIWLDSDKRITLSHEDFNNNEIVYVLK